MYYCPHPRNVGNAPFRRQQVTPPRERSPMAQVDPRPPQAIQILRPPTSAPIASSSNVNPSINVLSLEDEEKKNKGKEKIMELDAMPVKRARAGGSDEGRGESTSSDAQKKKKKKVNQRRRHQIELHDFPLGEKAEPYDLIKDVMTQRPQITWPQLLHLSPKMCLQWAKAGKYKEREI